ncbi:TPA: helix-turn-helix transcriptional regulator, partial [Klebsiella oxytoca]|nr:helix-turn-helix transcriptional regulator [Klebsiella oxytoca]
MTVAEKVKVYRLKKAWSQEQLAEIASISVRTVQRTEKGQKPGLETLSSLASAFEVNVSELMADTGDESNKLNECKKDVRKQVAQKLQFYWILTRFV